MYCNAKFGHSRSNVTAIGKGSKDGPPAKVLFHWKAEAQHQHARKLAESISTARFHLNLSATFGVIMHTNLQLNIEYNTTEHTRML